MGRSSLLTVRSFFLTVRSLLLAVNWLGLFCLRLKFGFVFFAYSSPPFGHWVWSLLLTVENQFGLSCLRFPTIRKLGLALLLTVLSPLGKTRRTVSKKTNHNCK